METKEIKINVPEGYEIDQENSTFECIKFKPIKKELPKTWKEFCKTHPRREGESWIDKMSKIEYVLYSVGRNRENVNDKNLLPNKELAEAMLALCQLIQLRDCYNGGWTPNWTDKNEGKYTILLCKGTIIIDLAWSKNRILSFKTEELRDQFFENFRDLIEIAKPLL